MTNGRDVEGMRIGRMLIAGDRRCDWRGGTGTTRCRLMGREQSFEGRWRPDAECRRKCDLMSTRVVE